MNVIQVAVIGVIGALLALQLKGGKTEYGIYMSVAAGIFLFACIIDRLEIFIRTVEQIGSYINLDAGYLGTMLKMVGITYIAEFSSGICRDAGYQTIAVQIEIFSRLTILALGMPVLLALLVLVLLGYMLQQFLVVHYILYRLLLHDMFHMVMYYLMYMYSLYFL